MRKPDVQYWSRVGTGLILSQIKFSTVLTLPYGPALLSKYFPALDVQIKPAAVCRSSLLCAQYHDASSLEPEVCSPRKERLLGLQSNGEVQSAMACFQVRLWSLCMTNAQPVVPARWAPATQWMSPPRPTATAWSMNSNTFEKTS